MIEDKITINKNFISSFKNEMTTPFKEILPIEPSKIYDFKRLISLFKKRNYSKKPDFQKLIKTLQDCIFENWDSSKENIILHSAGIDTRVISSLIRKVYLEKGGKVKFICLEPEAKYCSPILQHVGWDPSKQQVISFDPLYDKRNLDFNNFWKPVNGCSSFPQNFINYIIENYVEDTNKTVIWGGVFFNEAFETNGSIREFLIRMYYHRHFTYPSPISIKPDIIMPLFNVESLKVILESEFRAKNRIKLLEFLDPVLFKIPTISIPELYSYYKVDDESFKILTKNVKKSFYYKNINNSIIFNSSLRKNEKMWTAITLASFIEHLLERNITIKF